MKKLEAVTSKYKSMYAASKALGIDASHLRKLANSGALVTEKGEIYIKSKTKIKVDNETI